MSARILICDDEQDFLETVSYQLSRSGYRTLEAPTGTECFDLARAHSPDLIVLDLMLPDLEGTEVCRRLSMDPQTRHIPVMILSARDDEVDRIVGFELGATDYIVKPCSMKELVLRVRAILRRQATDQARDVVAMGSLAVDSTAHRTWVAGREVDLTPREFKLLETLLRHPGRVLSRNEVIDLVWPDDAEILDRSVDALVLRLRNKLGEASRLIQTVRGVGYRCSAATH